MALLALCACLCPWVAELLACCRWQGTIVKRHRIPKEGGVFFTTADFVVGGIVRIYARDYCIVDADQFTRSFSTAQGQPQPPALPWPVNPIEAYREAKSRPSGLSRADPDSPSKFAEALLGKEAISKRLVLDDAGVLRFYSVWDDRNALYGCVGGSMPGGWPGPAICTPAAAQQSRSPWPLIPGDQQPVVLAGTAACSRFTSSLPTTQWR